MFSIIIVLIGFQFCYSQSSFYQAYQKRLELQNRKQSHLLQLDRESHLKQSFSKWSSSRSKGLSKISFEVVQQFCKQKVEHGCSWQEAHVLLYDAYSRETTNRQTMSNREMIQEWILPTEALRGSLPSNSKNSRCVRLKKFPTQIEFIQKYLTKSVPFVVEGGLVKKQKWKAIGKWNLRYLNKTLYNEKIKLYISLDGDFEKIQSVRDWKRTVKRYLNYDSPQDESDVKDDELIMIRPAETEFSFDNFTYLSTRYLNEEGASFYLQKHDLRLWKEKYNLLKDISPFMFGEKPDKQTKRRNRQNKVIDIEHNGIGFTQMMGLMYYMLWMGVGNSRGPIHFDEYENVFAMVKGSKTWTLVHPLQSAEMYESNANFRSGHLLFDFDFANSKTKKKGKGKGRTKLPKRGQYWTLPINSSNYAYQPFSPVNVTHPDYKTHPLFKQAHVVTCKINAGDVMYLPSYWWHEVATDASAESDGLAIGTVLYSIINNYVIVVCIIL